MGKQCYQNTYNDTEFVQTYNLLVKFKDRTFSRTKVKSHDFYRIFVKGKSMPPTTHHRWESEYYNANFNWETINVIPYECYRETSLQS